MAAFGGRSPLDFTPGEQWRYSNAGYALLGYLIERISGKAYQVFLRDNIFTPLGMTNSGYDSNSEIIPQRASGYRRTESGFANAMYLDPSVPYAAGGLYSTAEDLLKWTRALFGLKLLSAESLKKMTTPVMNSYGFGLNIQSVRGRTTIFHAGGINGFTSVLVYYPASQVTIAVLSNVANADDGIVTRLSALAHGDVP